ncbi:MAG: hypothetical protein A2144_14865 [Chloroflexi bacterium RBG_16_50_9]|nr:MAG: hypothetical protein A2144_14865 [Chloroflexi bacterium RBG_16_50_9]
MDNPVAILTASGARIAAGVPHVGNQVPDITALLAFYEDNKYPLVTFKNGHNGNPFLNSMEFKTAYERHAQKLRSLRAEYVLVRDRWTQQGVPCLAIKSGGSFLPFPYTSDNLDILIHEEHEAVARAILVQLGYIELKNLEESKKFLFRKFEGGELVSDIHLHTRVGWGVGFMDEDSLWAQARVSPDDEAVTIPSPEDTILITLAHAFYENKRFRLADIVKVRESCRNIIDWSYLERTADQAGWLDGLSFCLVTCAHLEAAIFGETLVPQKMVDKCQARIKHWSLINRYYRHIRSRSPVSLPFTVSFVFGKFLFYKKVLNDRRHSLVARLYQAVRTLVRGIKLKGHIRPQPPFLVTFSGLDGAGKSQHAQTLASCLDRCGLKTRYVWSRCATSGITRFFSLCGRVFFWRRSDFKVARPSSLERRQRLQNPFLRFFWSYLVAADMVLTNLFRVRLPLLGGKLVICDRYIFDAAAEMEASLTTVDRYNRSAIKLILACAPKPDIAYLLDVPESVSAQRKENVTGPEYLRRERNFYLELANLYHLRIKGTGREFSDNADEIVREVAASFYDRFPTFLNGIFLSNPAQLNRKKEGGVS